MVVIPLISALYDVPIAEAQEYVIHSTATTRLADSEYPEDVHLPETEVQEEVIRKVEDVVRCRKCED